MAAGCALMAKAFSKNTPHYSHRWEAWQVLGSGFWGSLEGAFAGIVVAAAAPAQRFGEELQAAQGLVAFQLQSVDLLLEGVEERLSFPAQSLKLLVG